MLDLCVAHMYEMQLLSVSITISAVVHWVSTILYDP